MFQRIRAENQNYLAHSTSNNAPWTISKDTGEFIRQERRNLRSTAEFSIYPFSEVYVIKSLQPI